MGGLILGLIAAVSTLVLAVKMLQSKQETDNGFSDDAVNCTKEDCPYSAEEKAKTKAKRMRIAQEAMDYAKNQFPNGAGNMRSEMNASNLNSYYRLSARRNNNNFNIPPEVEQLASQNPNAGAAFVAAQSELTGGGNCGEHAFVVFDYIRRNYPEETVQVSRQGELDHQFVLIGDTSIEGDDSLVAADAWPTNPEPLTWDEHFAYENDRSELHIDASAHGDGRNYKQEMIDMGLSLNENGESLVNKKEPNDNLDKEMHDLEFGQRKYHIWENTSTRASPILMGPN